MKEFQKEVSGVQRMQVPQCACPMPLVGVSCHAVSSWTLILVCGVYSVLCDLPQSRAVHQEWLYIHIYRQEPSEHAL